MCLITGTPSAPAQATRLLTPEAVMLGSSRCSWVLELLAASCLGVSPKALRASAHHGVEQGNGGNRRKAQPEAWQHKQIQQENEM